MQFLPFYVYLVFTATLLVAILLWFKLAYSSKTFLVGMLSWISLQSLLAISGFYADPKTMSARFPLLILPTVLLIVFGFATKRGRAFIDRLDLALLTIMSVIRIPVELVLFWLFMHQAIPVAMTFEGRNWDVVSGITAPLIYYFGVLKQTLSKRAMLVWNFICLALLINVVANALLSLPSLYQKFGFERPNIALGAFPFILLPSFLVPTVLFCMLASIKKLVQVKD